jgi:hypothetical protein
LETGHCNYQNYNWQASQACFARALELAGLQFEMTGVRGKRTKFQQNDLAQLFLKVSKKQSNEQPQLDVHLWTYVNSEMDAKLLPKVYVLGF